MDTINFYLVTTDQYRQMQTCFVDKIKTCIYEIFVIKNLVSTKRMFHLITKREHNIKNIDNGIG